MKTMVCLFYYKENLTKREKGKEKGEKKTSRKNYVRNDTVTREVEKISGVCFGAMEYKLLRFLVTAQLK